MKASPCGRLAASVVHGDITCELALGMDATLETTERELGRVREILRRAVDGLVAEYGATARHEGVVALQFQDLSDQLLARAERRIGMVRSVLGRNVAPPAPHEREGANAGYAEFFARTP